MSSEGQSPRLADQKSPVLAMDLRTPRAAAIAGMVFSVLLIISFWLLRTSVPADPGESGLWLDTSSERVLVALNLVPFAGIAFMWFLGVLRDRLGAREDKFFATVFLGSGLLFLGMLFVSAAAMGAIVLAHHALPEASFDGATFAFARAFTYNLMHIYAFKMVAVFMITTSTLALNTRITARWIVLLGYASAVLILIGSGFLDWVFFVFPCWVLLVSIYILLDNMRKPPPAEAHDR
jgi:hypothetical protein